jgi:RHS repeat-associated protein
MRIIKLQRFIVSSEKRIISVQEVHMRKQKRVPFVIVLFFFALGMFACVPKAVLEVTPHPASGQAPFLVQFDASQTTDQGNDITRYDWDFEGDGTIDMSGGNLTEVTHSYGKAGTYTARVNVRDRWAFTGTTSVKIVVTASPNNIVDQYGGLIPGNSSAAYDAKRFAVLSGEVRDAEADGAPLEDVKITVHKLNEYGLQYGSAMTGAQGKFSLPVNGGLAMTIVYEKEEYLTVHRQVSVPWNEVAVAETVYMKKPDAASPPITLNNPTTQIHRASPQTDTVNGHTYTRACSLVFAPNTSITQAQDANGNPVNPQQIKVRATEYTMGPNGPQAMPAYLPPTNAYTYCVELRAELNNGQALKNVTFDKPVITWVNNFLNISVGQGVPVGCYNQEKAVWEGSEDGLVVRLLHLNDPDVPYASDPEVVNALDANGDGNPDKLGFNEFIDAVAGLQDKTKYHPNETYWRVKLLHFSTVDFNWPWGFPPDAIFFDPSWKYGEDGEKPQEEYCGIQVNSYVNERSQSFHEDIPVPGTDFTLHYSSSRVEGYQHRIRIPITTATVPNSLEKIIVKIEVAGKVFYQERAKGYIVPNDFMEFDWDGKDYLGNRLTGSITAHISIGYAYIPYYASVNGDAYIAGNYYVSWMQSGRLSLAVGTGRDFAIAWWREDLQIDLAPKSTIAEGWTLSNHHYASPNDPSTLHKGDGTIVKDKAAMMFRVAGEGGEGSSHQFYNGDNIPATTARFCPAGIAVDSAGNLYIADEANNRIRMVDAQGIITTVAGNGQADPNNVGDGNLAVNASLYHPQNIAFDAQGTMYIADMGDQRIRKVGPDNIISTIAGSYFNQETCVRGDGFLAINAFMCGPYNVDVDRFGNIYLIDKYCIRKIDTNGIIRKVAGDGDPQDLAIDDNGNVFFVSNFDGFIKKLDPQGTLTNYSTSNLGCTSWGMGMGMDKVGNFYVGVSYMVKKVDTSGNISIFAGTGQYGYNPEGGIPTQTPLYRPNDIVVDQAGNIYISDSGYNCVWKIVKSSAAYSAMAGGGITFVEDGTGYVMDPYGRHQKTIDLDTGASLYEFGYDTDGNLTSITDRFGDRAEIQRSGTAISITAHAGRSDQVTTTLTLNTQCQITRVAYPDTNAYDFQYAAGGLITDEWDPKQNHFAHSFDQYGRVYQTSDPLSGGDHPWQFGRQVLQNLGIVSTTVTSPEGNVTVYDDAYYPTGAFESTITGPADDSTTYSRSADGMVVQKNTPCGMHLHFEYALDDEYRYRSLNSMEETAGGKTRTTEWNRVYQDTNADDFIDLITETITVNGKSATIETDVPLNPLTITRTVTTPQGRIVNLQYDAQRLVPTYVHVDGLNPVTYQYWYEGGNTGRPTRIVIISGTRKTEIVLAYAPLIDRTATVTLSDTVGTVASITTYHYDIMDRIARIEQKDPADGTTVVNQAVFEYDANGNVWKLKKPKQNGSLIDHVFGYNGVDLADFYNPPVVTNDYTYVYDRDRNLTYVYFPTNNRYIHNTYVQGRLDNITTSEGDRIDVGYVCTAKVGSLTRNNGQSIGYIYDNALLRKEDMTAGALQGRSIEYTYDNDFAVASLKYAGGTVTYTYDNDGLLTNITGAGAYAITRALNNGLPTAVAGGTLNLSRGFSSYGELAGEDYSIDGSSRYVWGVADYYPDGKIKNRTETVGGSATTYVYTYDATGRLRFVDKDGVRMEEYEYYPNGGRSREVNRYPYKNIDRGFNYGDDDRMTAAGQTTYTFTDDGFLHTKTRGSDTTTYTYGALGELTAVDLPGGQVIEYVYDPLGRRIARQVGGVTTDKYLWQDMTHLLAVYNGDDTLKFRFEYADARMPVAMTNGSGTRYYLMYDQVGSLRLVTDADGSVVKHVEYDSFGGVISDSNPSFDMPFGFAGGLYDTATKFVHLGFRDYDPDTGRWTAKDPILFSSGDTNLYGYCLNDPVNLIDPAGYLALFWHGWITYEAARDSGIGRENSLGLAWGAMMADFGTQDPEQSNLHAMARPEQTPSEAIEATKELIDSPCSSTNLITKIHAAEDLATPKHAGKTWRGFHFNMETARHLMGDFTPTEDTKNEAYWNARHVLGSSPGSLYSPVW